MTDDFYKILQVDPSAEPEVIKAAYRMLAQKYHPDLNGSSEAAEKMKRLNMAYEVLKDAARRAEYDRNRRLSTSSNAWHAAQQPSYTTKGQPGAHSAPYISSFFFSAQPLRQSKAWKKGFWVGLLAGAITLLVRAPTSGSDGRYPLTEIITDLWIGVMVFLLAWGVIWSVGDLLTHIYGNPWTKIRKRRGNQGR